MGEQIADRSNPSQQLKVNANGSIDVNSGFNTVRITYNSNEDEEYIGLAEAGTLDGSSSWKIMKLIYNSDNNLIRVLFADGNTDFDNAWADRTSLGYGYQGSVALSADAVLT